VGPDTCCTDSSRARAIEIKIDPGKLTLEGTAAGDEMKLNVTGTQGDNYLLIGKRQK
jgi:hypothetical protein